MMFQKIQQQKEKKIQQLNNKGEVVNSFTQLAIIYHLDKYIVHSFGELKQQREELEKLHKESSFKWMIVFSDDWKCDELENLISVPGYIENIDYEPDSDFVDSAGFGMIYSCHHYDDARDIDAPVIPKQEIQKKTLFSIENSGIDLDLIPDDLKEKLGL